MLLVHFKKAFPFTLLGHSLKVELTDYCFILKVTRVFPIPTQARDYSFLFVRKKTETWLVSPISK